MKKRKLVGLALACTLLLGMSTVVNAEENSGQQNGRTIPELVEEASPLVANQGRSTGNVSAGYINDYLEGTDSLHQYTATVPSGYMLQAQLNQPGDSSIDYDLYIFDTNSNILSFSTCETNVVNGTTLPEGVGFVNSSDSDMECVIVVNSYMGGSTTNPYTLSYAFTDIHDAMEPDEQPLFANDFVMDGNYDSISSRNISSPLDCDWYRVVVPSNCDQMQLSLSTASTNSHSVSIYRNSGSDGNMKMTPVSSSNGSINVSEGQEYYLRVYYNGSLNGFAQNSIENYTLEINFSEHVLSPGSISISGYSGGTYVTYGNGRHYRVTGNTLTVNGVVRDTEGNLLPNAYVVAAFENPAWAGDSRYGTVMAEGVTNSVGQYSITITLPPSAGFERYYVNPSTHYYDTCTLIVLAGDGVYRPDYIYQFAYSAYGNNM